MQLYGLPYEYRICFKIVLQSIAEKWLLDPHEQI